MTEGKIDLSKKRSSTVLPSDIELGGIFPNKYYPHNHFGFISKGVRSVLRKTDLLEPEIIQASHYQDQFYLTLTRAALYLDPDTLKAFIDICLGTQLLDNKGESDIEEKLSVQYHFNSAITKTRNEFLFGLPRSFTARNFLKSAGLEEKMKVWGENTLLPFTPTGELSIRDRCLEPTVANAIGKFKELKMQALDEQIEAARAILNPRNCLKRQPKYTWVICF